MEEGMEGKKEREGGGRTEGQTGRKDKERDREGREEGMEGDMTEGEKRERR